MVPAQKTDMKTSGTDKNTQLCLPNFLKSCQKHPMEKRQLLQQMLPGKLDIYRKLKLVPCLSPLTSINSEWIKDLSIRPETLKLVQKRAGNTWEAIDIGNDFLSRTQVAQKLSKRTDKWD
jgi:hypothetical protein